MELQLVIHPKSQSPSWLPFLSPIRGRTEGVPAAGRGRVVAGSELGLQAIDALGPQSHHTVPFLSSKSLCCCGSPGWDGLHLHSTAPWARHWVQLQEPRRAGQELRACGLIKHIMERAGQIWACLTCCQHRADPRAHSICCINSDIKRSRSQAAEYQRFTLSSLRAKHFGFTFRSWQMSADLIILVTKCRASLVRNSCEVVHQTLAAAQGYFQSAAREQSAALLPALGWVTPNKRRAICLMEITHQTPQMFNLNGKKVFVPHLAAAPW